MWWVPWDGHGGARCGRSHVPDMTADILGRREEASIVLFRLKENDIQLGKEEQDEGDDGWKTDKQGKGVYNLAWILTYRLIPDAQGEWDDVLVWIVINGHKSDPNNEGRVHGETNEFGLIKILRHVARLYGVQRTEANKDKVKAKRRRNSWEREKRKRKQIMVNGKGQQKTGRNNSM